METKSLTREDWLNLALAELRDHGYTALKAQPLAQKLNVTRGSFYYHFESLEVFHAAIITHWSNSTTGPVSKQAKSADSPRDALDSLLQTTLRSGEALERAIRSWSTVSPAVARAVEQVDQGRIKVAEKLLVDGGVSKPVAMSRAKVLYWAAIGRLMLPFPNNNLLSQKEISDLAGHMMKG